MGSRAIQLKALHATTHTQTMTSEALSSTFSFLSGKRTKAGRRIFRGTEGDDKIVASKKNDYINGWVGDDTIRAGDGDDIVRGGSGDDTLIGGSGADTFYINQGKNVI